MSETRIIATLIIATSLVMAPGGWLLLPVLGANQAQRCGLVFVLAVAVVTSLAMIVWDAWSNDA